MSLFSLSTLAALSILRMLSNDGQRNILVPKTRYWTLTLRVWDVSTWRNSRTWRNNRTLQPRHLLILDSAWRNHGWVEKDAVDDVSEGINYSLVILPRVTYLLLVTWLAKQLCHVLVSQPPSAAELGLKRWIPCVCSLGNNNVSRLRHD